jgi:hypothetical protein
MFSNTAAVPGPNNLVAGHTPGGTRWVAYLDATTGAPEGMQKQVKLYNASGDTVKGGVYRVAMDGDEETNPKVVDVTAQTIAQFYVVSPKVITDATWGWFVIEGPCLALVDGDTTDVAKDDFLKLIAGTNADAFVSDGTATLTDDSLAIACEANTSTEALKKVILLGLVKDAD